MVADPIPGDRTPGNAPPSELVLELEVQSPVAEDSTVELEEEGVLELPEGIGINSLSEWILENSFLATVLTSSPLASRPWFLSFGLEKHPGLPDLNFFLHLLEAVI